MASRMAFITRSVVTKVPDDDVVVGVVGVAVVVGVAFCEVPGRFQWNLDCAADAGRKHEKSY